MKSSKSLLVEDQDYTFENEEKSKSGVSKK